MQLRAQTGHEATAHVRRIWTPEIVVSAPGRVPVTLLMVTEWLDHLSVHLAWPECGADPHAGVREAFQLTDAAGTPCAVVASAVVPLADRMNEVTYFDTRLLRRPQTLSLRLRSRLDPAVPLPFGG